jgi:hypothetical protein
MEEIRGINSADKLPRTANGEAAFAASNTNIVIKGNYLDSLRRNESGVFYSADKGNTWEVYDTPIVQGKR